MLFYSKKLSLLIKNIPKNGFSSSYQATLNKTNGVLELIDQNKRKFDLHPQWLRERSQSDSYVHPEFKQPMSDCSIYQHSIKSYTIEENKLNVSFQDENQSEYDISSIIEEIRDNSRATQFNLKSCLPKPILWKGSEFSIPTFDFLKVEKDEKSQLKMFEALLQYGLGAVKNVETTKEGLFKLTNLIGHVKNSNFGESFLVKENEILDKVDDDTAYRNIKLMPHTDLPYVEDPPGWQLLHCLENKVKGKGLAIYVDGFEAAEHLRKNNPKYFDILANYLVRFEFKGKTLAQMEDRTIFSLDSKGEMKRICYNSKVGGYALYSADLEKINLFYEAKREWANYLYDEKNMKLHEMEEGVVYFFDNWRTFHGRTEYPQGGKRALHGCYLEHPMIKSRYLSLVNNG